MNEDIKATQMMIERQVENGKIFSFGIPFSEYQKVYAETNENIKGYMSQLNFEGKTSTLSVMASGDHIFNAAFYGIKDIDTFDTNKLTEYYVLGIKRSAILAFDYSQFSLFISKIIDEKTSLEELTELIKLIIPYMDKKHSNYWEGIISFNYHLQHKVSNQLNLFQMLLINIQGKFQDTFKNAYLIDEESYNKLRIELSKVNITFKNCECLEIANNFDKQYDFIFLSNIADYFYKNLGNYWEYDKLQEIKNKFNKLLKEDGTLALAYLFRFYNVKSNKFNNHPIQNSAFQINDITTEDIITFPYIYKNREQNNVKDGLILEKKL